MNARVISCDRCVIRFYTEEGAATKAFDLGRANNESPILVKAPEFRAKDLADHLAIPAADEPEPKFAVVTFLPPATETSL